MIKVRLTSGDPAGALVAVNNAGITVFEVSCADDDITAEFMIRRQDCKALKQLCYRKGYELQIVKTSGLFWSAGRFLNRPVLMAAVLTLCLLTAALPSRILFFKVEGNESIPTNLILEECASTGVSFGCSRRLIRSEKVKNALLEAIPQLQWVGVTTSGCVATITVTERQIAQTEEKNEGINCIVALRDGVITQLTATKGNVLCKVGQAVSEGELLVSGYVDTGLCIRATGADAEIYAQTERELTVVTPSVWCDETQNCRSDTKYSLLIGKKRINFFKGSGISGTTCDKIYEENYITLPGGFQLPVAIVTETWTFCDAQETASSGEAILEEFADRYLRTQMTAGLIESFTTESWEEDGLIYSQGNYICTEMIARMQSEEILKPYGNDN